MRSLHAAATALLLPHGVVTMSVAGWLVAVVWPLLMGCGSAICAVRIARATDELARAEQLDAARKAPYEYQYALEHLLEARAESARADYGDAAALAAVAHDYASRAVQVAQRVERAKSVARPESP